MLKRTLFFINPCYLSIKHGQLIVRDKHRASAKTVPIEDIGYVILDNKQITITQSTAQAFAEANIALVICDEKHHPKSMMLNLNSHHLEAFYIDNQVEASKPLKKNLWKQTIAAKIKNQAALLTKHNKSSPKLHELKRKVRSGDSTGLEGLAAKIYWKKLITDDSFKRARYGIAPNSMFNYMYAVLRAGVAKALVGSGLLPALGIHHSNKYNAYRLADDIMEPYRPFADDVVLEVFQKYRDYDVLTPQIKAELLPFLSMDVRIDNKTRPLMVALSHTTASLAYCLTGERRTLKYPTFI